ncbi:hypothetical protein GGI15_004795 [Coemansia interrupta]|uniref:DUF1754-domain-containing protein n=1 Tax=Coemansia interrupta TaxID=1126814 RepID=A0A9W8H798_9FUNG|nr:hypothetical protein GGI15_004795 [Coemansia interrupta]
MSDAYETGVALGRPLRLKKTKGLFKKPTDNKKKHKSSKKKKSKDKQPAGDQPAEDEHAGPPAAEMTEAERLFQEAQQKRRQERIEKLAAKSHRDRIKEFNDKLERTPEHNDMPKVGPG